MIKIWLGLIGIILCLIGFFFVVLAPQIIVREGTATDVIARISYEGLIWKTWGVQLLNDHPITSYDGTIDQQKYGVVHDETVLRDIQTYQATGNKVRLYFKSYFWVWPWDYSDSEVIYKVERI